MTTFAQKEVRCAVCGTSAAMNVLASTNAMGSSDLDLRPPEMQRSTMHTWVQQCPQCGFCNGSIEDAPSGSEQLIASPRYRTQLEDERMPELARRFMCAAMVVENEDRRSAAHSKLCAAWDCDDAELPDLASECRRGAIALLEDADELQDPSQAVLESAIIIDMLRRIGDFSLASERCEQLVGITTDENLLAILGFQKDLISAQDTACHSVDEALA
jgi:hypothetical protein